jgi:hypothetical protein
LLSVFYFTLFNKGRYALLKQQGNSSSLIPHMVNANGLPIVRKKAGQGTPG